MNIYIASITGISSRKDSRVQVRVLPDMENIEKDYLPLWPSFFKNSIITGKVGDLVWCVANEDFTTGFVLGYANTTTEMDNYSPSSIPEKLYNTIDDVHVNLRGFLLNYRDILVTNYSNESISFIQRTDSSHIIAFANGTIHIVKPNEIYFHVGTSTLSIKDGEIAMEADNIRIGGKKVALGNHPVGQVLASDGGKTAKVTSRVSPNVFA